MPIYEYYCPDCKEKFELMRSASQCSAPAECRRCKKQAGRVLSRFAAVSRGQGGVTAPVAGGGGGCSGCSSSSCGSCGG